AISPHNVDPVCKGTSPGARDGVHVLRRWIDWPRVRHAYNAACPAHCPPRASPVQTNGLHNRSHADCWGHKAGEDSATCATPGRESVLEMKQYPQIFACTARHSRARATRHV